MKINGIDISVYNARQQMSINDPKQDSFFVMRLIVVLKKSAS